ncbi:hypothetical protein Taro_049162 [Colocasia esculenta]|uniref:IBH1-like N-terminal domain-containing protein n=1 Tax=Colocasia esculenta TaxID=4460 RepID=A0A843XAA2_COLES|nr:hypothetical protein [Colocasia esculenta]
MADAQGSRRGRSHALGPNMVVFAIFSHRYITYLLPALFKVGASRLSHGNKDKEVKSVVRFEVDMALVLSARGFAWSHALREKLEQEKDVKKQKKKVMPTTQMITLHDLSSSCKAENGYFIMLANILSKLWEVPLITRPLAPADVHRGKVRWKRAGSGCTLNPRRRQLARGGGEELGCCIRTLRRILPGGDEMGVGQLLSEVESYVICLQMQVSVLRSILDARQQQLS